ncbi:MAG: glycosyltransferase family 4 protein [Arhodomonas sp.]|nr:glycosyltransferase family 4 protein [Arhodomonas sp.]
MRPDLVHLVTIKPVLYGGLMARLLRVPAAVAAISGMGFLFTGGRRGPARRAAELLYRLALGHGNGRVMVQNTTDRDGLRAMGALRRGQEVLIPGSGVDLDRFRPVPLPDGEPLVVLPARMLWDKGVGEFVAAAVRLRDRGVAARFALVGAHNETNPAAVPLETLQQWRREGAVEWWGQQEDMPAVLGAASVVVLPSFYGEGVPKALLEALAAGRAVVTTDHPGCRDVVDDGVNGRLVPVRDAEGLADAIAGLLADRDRLEALGLAGRRMAEERFGVERVVAAHMAVYEALGEKAPVARAQGHGGGCPG